MLRGPAPDVGVADEVHGALEDAPSATAVYVGRLKEVGERADRVDVPLVELEDARERVGGFRSRGDVVGPQLEVVRAQQGG